MDNNLKESLVYVYFGWIVNNRKMVKTFNTILFHDYDGRTWGYISHALVNVMAEWFSEQVLCLQLHTDSLAFVLSGIKQTRGVGMPLSVNSSWTDFYTCAHTL